jgi:hypothetical protein
MILLGVWYIDTDSIFKSVPDIKFGVFLSVRTRRRSRARRLMRARR